MTDKERLEELKEWFDSDGEIHEFQIEWLIEQAENFQKVFGIVNDFKSGETSMGEFIDDLLHSIKD